MGELLGYARVSTVDQNAGLQLDALQGAGCVRVFSDTASGALDERPELRRALDHLREGDTLVVWRLDRLGRSLRHLIDAVTTLAERGVGFRSLQESIDTTTPGGRLVFHVFRASRIRARPDPRTHPGRPRRRPCAWPPRWAAAVMTPDKLAVAREMHASGEHTAAAIAVTIGVSREGHGRRMVETALDIAGRRGATSMELSTATNDHAARVLYDHLGFSNLEKEGDLDTTMLYYERDL